MVELLVVIAIIGILAAVLVVNLQSSRAKSRDATRMQDMHTLQLAFESYFNDCFQYPEALDVTSDDGCPVGITLATHLASIPHDPLATNPDYAYVLNATDDYTVTFTLENGVDRFDAGVHTLEPDGVH